MGWKIHEVWRHMGKKIPSQRISKSLVSDVMKATLRELSETRESFGKEGDEALGLTVKEKMEEFLRGVDLSEILYDFHRSWCVDRCGCDEYEKQVKKRVDLLFEYFR